MRSAFPIEVHARLKIKTRPALFLTGHYTCPRKLRGRRRSGDRGQGQPWSPAMVQIVAGRCDSDDLKKIKKHFCAPHAICI